MTDSVPVSWRTVAYGSPVRSADGAAVGAVVEVLGSDEEDIFHGLRVRLSGGSRDVMLSPDDVASLGPGAVTTVLSAADIAALPAFDEAATYHLSSVGWLRKHLGWARDDRRDEEPG